MRVELGCPGHFIAVRYCRWRRHTEVDHYKISTVGDYYYPESIQKLDENHKKRQTLGYQEDSFFETMVFKLNDNQQEKNEGCGCRETDGWSELECIRYPTAGEAQAGHEAMVAKYEGMP